MTKTGVLEQRVIENYHLAAGDELLPDSYPILRNLSAAFLFRFLPYPKHREPPEFVYIDLPNWSGRKGEEDANLFVKAHSWNLAWETGNLRYDIFGEALPASLKWLEQYKNRNIYLLPKPSIHNYQAFVPLYHLLPQATLERFGLPLLKSGLWPAKSFSGLEEKFFPKDFNQRLSSAFASHIWPYLISQSGIHSFSSDDPIKILAHNLDFWLPYIHQVAEERMLEFPRVKPEKDDDIDDIKDLAEFRKALPSDVIADKPRMGGTLWMGEDEARSATVEMLNKADQFGRLRGIIDAIKSNRVKDDFSQKWSYAKEDFERKVYKKRAKVKVHFVELNETIPVHGINSEFDTNLIWEDFLAILDQKERKIVILLTNGVTKLGDVGKLLGYATHSPISKSLNKIRKKAMKLLDD